MTTPVRRPASERPTKPLESPRRIPGSRRSKDAPRRRKTVSTIVRSPGELERLSRPGDDELRLDLHLLLDLATDAGQHPVPTELGLEPTDITM